MKYHRADLADALRVAHKRVLKDGKVRYVVPTPFGWEICHNHVTFDQWYEITCTGNIRLCERDYEHNTVTRKEIAL